MRIDDWVTDQFRLSLVAVEALENEKLAGGGRFRGAILAAAGIPP